MRRQVPPPEEWDGGEWVDVGPDGRWRPSTGERFRALVVLAIVIGILAALAALVSAGGDGDEDDEEVAATSSTTEAPSTTSSTTTQPPDPASVGGEPPPPPCAADDRGGAPLRDAGQVVVRVLNGTSRGGHAGSVSDDLGDAGYRMLEPSNADLLPVTRVAFEPGYCAEAAALAGVLAIAGTEVVPADPAAGPPESPRSDLTVTLGRDSL